MRNYRAIKVVGVAASTAVILLTSTMIAKADQVFAAEKGVAGIAVSLENTSAKDLEDAYKASVEILNIKVNSPYANLGVSKANNFVNIRSKPSTESEIVGKLYRGCAADILEYLDGGWVKIKSGDVNGYIASDYLAIGDAAEAMSDEYATKYATVVNTATLRVREGQGTDTDTLALIPGGETYVVLKEHEEWAEILLGAEENGRDLTGFVSKDYLEIKVEFKFAISIEEEQRMIKAQQEAERAERERLERLAQEKAEREEAARRAAEAKKNQQKNNQKSTETKVVTSSTGSKLGIEISTYAQKFIGNPYKWGGESLTKGADCSGFVQTIYRQFGYSIPRTSREQAGFGKKVSVDNMQPGDLIFYASKGRVNHVAMYIGNGMIVHAANSRQGIIRSKYNYRAVYCVRRVI